MRRYVNVSAAWYEAGGGAIGRPGEHRPRSRRYQPPVIAHGSRSAGQSRRGTVDRASSTGRRCPSRSSRKRPCPSRGRGLAPFSQGSSSVNRVTHCRQVQRMRVMSVPQNMRRGPNASNTRCSASWMLGNGYGVLGRSPPGRSPSPRRSDVSPAPAVAAGGDTRPRPLRRPGGTAMWSMLSRNPGSRVRRSLPPSAGTRRRRGKPAGRAARRSGHSQVQSAVARATTGTGGVGEVKAQSLHPRPRFSRFPAKRAGPVGPDRSSP